MPTAAEDTLAAAVHDAIPRPILHLDVEKYQAALSCPEMRPEQKQELLEALWLIIVMFVDLGFSIEPQNTSSLAQGET